VIVQGITNNNEIEINKKKKTRLSRKEGIMKKYKIGDLIQKKVEIH